MSDTSAFSCDFCEGTTCTVAYVVPGSARDMKIAVCDRCGLVQSIGAQSAPETRVVSTTSGATWGNIRHGKGLRLQQAIPLLEEHVDWRAVTNVLDVGSNRGDFLLWLNGAHPGLALTGVEPDLTVVADYADMPNLDFRGARLENVELPPAHFDFVYCSHTLEHAASASQMLKAIYVTLKPGGRLFLEVPNIAILMDPEISEEFFIDKHSFHFSHEILALFARHLNYEVCYASPKSDIGNITFILTRGPGALNDAPFAGFDPLAAANAVRMIGDYEQALTRNREKLKPIAERLNAFMDRQRVAFWGGGRLFDALVRFGDLDTGKVHVLVDAYLSKYLTEVHGVKLYGPDKLRSADPQVLVILAKSSAADIAKQARRYGINNVISFSELYQSV